MLPVPDALEEFLTAEVVAGEVLVLAQLLLHFDLRGNARMVGAGHPQRAEALHPLVADEDVLERLVECVSHMELARDVRRGNDDRERRLAVVHIGGEIALVAPILIDSVFKFARGIGLCEFAFHIFLLKRLFCKIKSALTEIRARKRGTTWIYHSCPITGANAGLYLLPFCPGLGGDLLRRRTYAPFTDRRALCMAHARVLLPVVAALEKV